MYTSMAKETKTTAAKVKPTDPGGSSKGKIDSSINRKKIESSNKQYVDYKQKSVSTITKSEVKSKTTSASIKTTTTKTTTKVREKKVYTLPGQKYDIPEEREPLRIFYESLSKQIPSSEMAEFWLMEHGILSPERSKKAYEKKQKKQKELRMGTPVKASSKPESSHRQQQLSKNGNVKAKKRITNESDNDGFILSPKRRKG